jgi:hypothetical protein
MRRLAVFALVGLLAACGPSKPAEPGKAAKATAPSGAVLPTGPLLSGVGVVASVERKIVTLDHEAVEGGLPAGRHAFIADAAVAAEAPLEPGSRVAFTYQDWTPTPLLVELKAR